MIYNLSEYIKLNSSITPVTNGYNPQTTGDSVSLIQTGGSDPSRGLKIDYTVQLLSRSSSQTKSFKMITEVYDLLKNRFKIILPEVVVDSVTFPELTVDAMLPLQEPGYIGADDNGLHEWSVNFKITTRRI